MKFVIVFSVLLVSALARPADDSKNAQILSYENDNIGLDSYKFGYETSDGTKRQESAVVNNFGSDAEELVVRGTISWITPEGETITLNYVADKDGYRPEGAHIPSK
ncbi:flexible cuticle protein 12-like [Chironomus tepperi]|uniref:flexible cuticle protein 12-like n=1 Tax=Chironomus tepperi TaxID=113505 RepID=UPI00391FABA2